jgi:hypothetical protein
MENRIRKKIEIIADKILDKKILDNLIKEQKRD